MQIAVTDLTGCNIEYEARDVIRIFFPASKVCFSRVSFENQTDLHIIITLDENCSTVWLEDIIGRTIQYSLDLYEFKHLRPSVKILIKRIIYTALQSYTGEGSPWGILTGIRPAKIVHTMLDNNCKIKYIHDILEGFYLLSEDKAGLLIDTAMHERRILKLTRPDMISLYIGIPFCTSRCLYCSFTSYSIGRYRDMVDDYLKALFIELEAVKGIISDHKYRIQSVFIGGGTPTSLSAAQLASLLGYIQDTFDLDDMEEYTLEAGRPDTFDHSKLLAVKNSRVTRISINPQTMNDTILKTIGRNHSSLDVVSAFSMARELGFNNINMDIIAGLPEETPEMFGDSLKKIMELDPESLTVHTMSIKRASILNENTDKWKLSQARDVQEMISASKEIAEQLRMKPYYLYRQKNILGNLENVGYAKECFEGIYNIQIMEERQSILAAGAGATTKIVYPGENRIERAFNVKNPEDYIKRINEMIERKKKVIYSGC